MERLELLDREDLQSSQGGGILANFYLDFGPVLSKQSENTIRTVGLRIVLAARGWHIRSKQRGTEIEIRAPPATQASDVSSLSSLTSMALNTGRRVIGKTCVTFAYLFTTGGIA
jgi:hypothetical protein